MTPQKKIRIGARFVAIWVLLGGAWLCDYFFGDTEFWKLASGELTVLLGIGAGTAMIREGRRGQEAENAAGKDAAPGNPAEGTAGKDAGSQAGNTAAKSTAARTARQPEEKNDKHRATRKRIPSRNCGSTEGPENLTL